MKTLDRVITENKAELDRHLTAVADIIEQAGAGDSICSIIIDIDPKPRGIGMLTLTWRRDT